MRVARSHPNLFFTVAVAALAHVGIGTSILAKHPGASNFGLVVEIAPLEVWAVVSILIGVGMFAGLLTDWRWVRVASTAGLFMALVWTLNFGIELFTGTAVFAPWLFLFYGAAHWAFTSEIPDNPAMHRAPRR